MLKILLSDKEVVKVFSDSNTNLTFMAIDHHYTRIFTD